MRVCCRMNRLTAAAMLLGLIPAAAMAQQGVTVSGRVTQGAGDAPVWAASVTIPDMKIGAQTDAQGRYSFTIPAFSVRGQPVTLTARRLGYTPSTVRVTLTGTGHDYIRDKGYDSDQHQHTYEGINKCLY